MSLTPTDIQKQEFKTKFKGYDPEEVRSFLIYIAEQFEILQRERDRLEEENIKQKETIKDLMSREELLKKTIMSTQKWVDEYKEKTLKESELIIKEAELKAEEITKDAYEKIRKLEDEIGDLKRTEMDTLSEITRLIEDLKRIKERIELRKEQEEKIRSILGE